MDFDHVLGGFISNIVLLFINPSAGYRLQTKEANIDAARQYRFFILG